MEVSSQESLFTAVSDPLEAPQVFLLRRTILSWRFYDSVRTRPADTAGDPHALTRRGCRRCWCSTSRRTACIRI